MSDVTKKAIRLRRKRSDLVTARNRDGRKEEVLKHLKDMLGVVTYACEKAGITTRTFYRWKESDPEFAARVEEVSEMQIDYVEKNLLSAIKDKNPACLIFYLKTKGRKRGYVERIEHTGADGQPISYEGSLTLKEKKEAMPDDSLAIAVTSLLARNPALRDKLLLLK